MRKHRPDIIWIGITAFGADGPYAGRPGIDFLAQGFGGLLALNGEPSGEPVRVTVPMIDVMTSLLVSTAALTALRTRDETGEGQRIDISLLDALLHAQASSLGTYLMVTGEADAPNGKPQPVLRAVRHLHLRRRIGKKIGDHVSVGDASSENLCDGARGGLVGRSRDSRGSSEGLEPTRMSWID